MNLRELLQQPAPEREPWADAQDFARSLFGEPVAAAITWSVNSDQDVAGVLTDGTNTLYLRHECEEPSSEIMWVNVQCPFDAECPYGWDLVSDVWGLLRVLDGGEGDGDPRCDLGEEDEHETPHETGIVEGMAAGWPPARQWPF